MAFRFSTRLIFVNALHVAAQRSRIRDVQRPTKCPVSLTTDLFPGGSRSNCHRGAQSPGGWPLNSNAKRLKDYPLDVQSLREGVRIANKTDPPSRKWARALGWETVLGSYDRCFVQPFPDRPYSFRHMIAVFAPPRFASAWSSGPVAHSSIHRALSNVPIRRLLVLLQISVRQASKRWPCKSLPIAPSELNRRSRHY